MVICNAGVLMSIHVKCPARVRVCCARSSARARRHPSELKASDIFLYSSTYIEITKQLHYNKLKCQVNRGAHLPITRI